MLNYRQTVTDIPYPVDIQQAAAVINRVMVGLTEDGKTVAVLLGFKCEGFDMPFNFTVSREDGEMIIESLQQGFVQADKVMKGGAKE